MSPLGNPRGGGLWSGTGAALESKMRWVCGGERGVTRGRFANFRIQATAGGLRCGLIEGEASPAAPDPERWADGGAL